MTLVVAAHLAPAPVAASSIYRWVDRHGDIHITDRIDDVPEPYRSLYAAAEQRRREEADKRTAAAKTTGKALPAVKPRPRPSRSRPAPTGASGYLHKQDAAREKWKTLVAHWRAELAAATDALARLDADIAAARLNPVLRETPQVRAKIATLQEGRPGAVGRVNHARNMLLVEIPQRARREQVSPKWIQ